MYINFEFSPYMEYVIFDFSRMNRLNSYIKVLQLFSQATLIYLRLRSFLKKEYFSNLRLSDDIKKDYYYHSGFYNRAKQYIHANHFFGELLSMVRGTKMTKAEMGRFVLLSSCAPVFDDFFEKDSDYSSIRELMHHPDMNNAKSDTEKLAAFFFSDLLSDIKNKEELLEAADQLFDAQLKSKTQSNTKLSNDELLKISINKGGYSGLMYGLLLDHKPGKRYLKLAFDLGSYGQLMDDIFDLYDDATQGIRTFVNQADSVKEIRMILEEHEQKVLDLINNMHLLRKDKESFERVLIVFSSIIEIALRQYEQIEEDKNLAPKNCLEINREYWIIDMEKAPNIWKLFNFSVQRI